MNLGGARCRRDLVEKLSRIRASACLVASSLLSLLSVPPSFALLQFCLSIFRSVCPVYRLSRIHCFRGGAGDCVARRRVLCFCFPGSVESPSFSCREGAGAGQLSFALYSCGSCACLGCAIMSFLDERRDVFLCDHSILK